MIKHKAKPFIKWVGGKGQLLSTFEEFLPNNLSEIDDLTYIEPFIGGGAMFFHMLQKYQNITKAVINDVNDKLIGTYRIVKTKPEALIESLNIIQKEYMKIDVIDERKDFFLEIRSRFNEGDLSAIDNATYFIFLNKTCFNGLFRVNSKGKFNVPFGKNSNPKICDAETIIADSKMLQKVEIINGDFEQTEKYISQNTFFYFDPPYRPLDATSNFNSYAKETFNDNEQIRLKEYFDKLSEKKCMLMLSNSDCRSKNPEDLFFDNLYDKYSIERVFASRSINSNAQKRGKLSELLIRNY